MRDSNGDYPFRCVLSLRPLIDFWRQMVASGEAKACLMEGLEERLAQAPELLRPIEDLSILNRHQDLLRGLMALVFPAAFWETGLVGALVPFNLRPVYVSPSFQKLMLNEDGSMKGRPLISEELYKRGRLLRAYFLILEKYYGIHQKLEYPIIRVVTDPDTGLDRYFRVNPDLRFVQVHHHGEVKELTEEERVRILENLSEPDVLKEILPPEHFEFHGFTAFQLVDVTQSEVISALERDLIDQESIFSRSGFQNVQERLRILFRCPDLVAGLAAVHDDQVLLLNVGCDLSHNCIFSDSRHVPISEFQGSVYERASMEKRVLLIRDLLSQSSRTRAEEEVLKGGGRCLMVAPLYYRGKLIGTLDLASTNPDEFRPMDAFLLEQIVPLFSMALKRALDELDNQVQGIIKEKCTAVHPTVEWRFREAAFAHLDRLRMGLASDLEPIVFRDVYPLFGVSDIRGSSEGRNRAIQADLEEHMKLALGVVRSAEEAKPLAILQEVTHRLHKQLERIQAGLRSGDEASIVGFMQREVEPLFSHLRGFSPRVSQAVKTYQTVIDPRMGTVYRKRSEFEESVSRLNQRISAYLDQEEAEAQSVFPHYFEKHQTDGVDYLIYVGGSLLEDGVFNELYLKNLRLWQLMVACGIAWHTEQLKAELKVPLDTAHLILVNHSLLSVRFRFDEKRFDVDGAYDIRQEIIKSRIDKAMIKERGERLTQPGKIAVVFSHSQEGKEIRRHLDFLKSRGYLAGDPEHLDLEALPGVQGLRAFRVDVDLESHILSQRIEKMAN